MALKDEWLGTGKQPGGALTTLGKTLVKTAKVGVDKADAWLDGADPKNAVPEKNVTNDGTWLETGKEVGTALAGLSRTLYRTAKVGISRARAKSDQDRNKK